MHHKLATIFFTTIALFVTSTSFAFKVVEEHMFTIPAAATPWDETVVVPQYNPADYGNHELLEVSFTLMGDAMSSVDIVSNGGPVVVLNGDVGAFITATGSVPGLFLDALPTGQFAPPTIEIPAGQSANLTDVSGSDMDTMSIDTSGDLSPYVGASSYSVDISAMGTSSLTTSGGNWDASQRTEANASLVVTYAIVPEPAAVGLVIFGVALMIWVRRKK